MSDLSISVFEKHTGSVLKVEKYDYGFRFYFADRTMSYFVKTDTVHPNAFLLVEEQNGYAEKIYSDTFANMGVKNICGLFIKLMFQPVETVYMLLGKRYEIGKVHIKDYSQRAKDGFDECVFADFLTPQQVLNAQPEG
jgi:hypothetical protein